MSTAIKYTLAMPHIVNDCINRKFSDGIVELNEVNDDAVEGLGNLDIWL